MGPYMRRLHDKQRSPFKKEQKLSLLSFQDGNITPSLQIPGTGI